MRKTFWKTSLYPKYKVTLEEFEDYGAQKEMIETIQPNSDQLLSKQVVSVSTLKTKQKTGTSISGQTYHKP